MIMDPMQMTLTKDHVRVLIEVIPKAAAEKFLPAIDSMAHYRYLKNILEEEKDPNILSVELSAIRNYMFQSTEDKVEEQKSNIPSGLAALAAEPNAADAAATDGILKRRLSLKSQMGWNESLGTARQMDEEEDEEEDM